MKRARLVVPITLVAGLFGGGLVGAASAAPTDGPSTSTGASGDVEYTDPSLADEATTTVKGVLRTIAVEPKKGERTASHDHSDLAAIFTKDGVVPVDLDVDADVAGTTVTAELVRGEALQKALDPAEVGTASEPVEVASATFAEPAAAAAPAMAHRAYVATVPASGSYGGTAVATLESRVDTGLAYWVDEADGAITSFTRPTSLRAIPTSVPLSDPCGFTDPVSLWDAAAARFSEVDWSAPANHLVVLAAPRCIDEGYGIGSVGYDLSSGGAVTMLAGPEGFTATLAHEIGHNASLPHASQTCADCEYYDIYSPMGLGIGETGPPALDSEFRSQLGIDQTGEIDVVQPGATKTVTLAGRGTESGVRGVEVRSGGNSYWVEWRSGKGRDADAYYPLEAEGYYLDETLSFLPGVTISKRPTGDVEGDSYLLPRVVNGKRIGAYQAGQTFAAGNVTVKVVSIGSTSATVQVSSASQLESSTPTISGTPRVYQTLTANPGTWSEGTTFSYQWYLGTTPIAANATGPTYFLTAGTKGKTISVRVTGSKPGFTSVTRTSAATAPIAAAPVVAGSTPTVSGTKRVGSVLTANPGTWTEGAELTYQWYLGDTPIKANATSQEYLLTAGSRGKTVSVRVTGSKPGFTSTTKASGASTIGYGILTAPTPTVEGTRTVGSTLTATAGEWTPGTTLTYQWYLGTVPIKANATSSRYLLTAGTKGKYVSVRVTGTKAGYTTVTKSSAQIGPIG